MNDIDFSMSISIRIPDNLPHSSNHQSSYQSTQNNPVFPLILQHASIQYFRCKCHLIYVVLRYLSSAILYWLRFCYHNIIYRL